MVPSGIYRANNREDLFRIECGTMLDPPQSFYLTVAAAFPTVAFQASFGKVMWFDVSTQEAVFFGSPGGTLNVAQLVTGPH